MWYQRRRYTKWNIRTHVNTHTPWSSRVTCLLQWFWESWNHDRQINILRQCDLSVGGHSIVISDNTLYVGPGIVWAFLIITVTSFEYHSISNPGNTVVVFNYFLMRISKNKSKLGITGPLRGESTDDTCIHNHRRLVITQTNSDVWIEPLDLLEEKSSDIRIKYCFLSRKCIHP